MDFGSKKHLHQPRGRCRPHKYGDPDQSGGITTIGLRPVHCPCAGHLGGVKCRLKEVEHRIGDFEYSVRDLHASIHTLRVKVKALESRAEDSENGNHGNNLRVVGLPEGAEGQDPAAFTEHPLCMILPQAPFSPHFAGCCL